MKKKKILVFAVAFVAALLLTTAACGGSGFEKFADFVIENGTSNDENGYVSVNAKNGADDLSAIYYAEDEEIVFGLRRKKDGITQALMLLLGKEADFCTLMFTGQQSGSAEADYAASGMIMLSDPSCKKLIVASGINKGETDYSMCETVNGLISELLVGADAYLLSGSGLEMSDLGFVY